MHYGVLVVVNPKDNEGFDLDGVVQAALERYEHVEWDWWQIGGRWTGALDGYDPTEDPANVDFSSPSKNNVAWPTEWKRHDGDVQPVSSLTQEHLDKFHAVVVNGSWHGGQDYLPWKEIGEMFPARVRPPLDWIKGHEGYVAIVVDCHN